MDPGWQTQPYLDQFNRMGRGEAGNVPVMYARGAKAIQAAIRDTGTKLSADPSVFGIMPQPVGPSAQGDAPKATIDCEPFVVFKSAEAKKVGAETGASLAKDFLRTFYSKKHYLKFVKNVPIHLTPVFRSLSGSPEYTGDPLIKTWHDWYDQTNQFLASPDRMRPILMPDLSENGKRLPFLLEFQASRILTTAVSDVIKNRVTPEAAADKAQIAAEKLVTSLGFKQW